MGDRVVQAPTESSVDVVTDLVAGERWPDLSEVLKPSGRYAVAGAIGGLPVEIDVRAHYQKDLSLFGCNVLGKGVFQSWSSELKQVTSLLLLQHIFSTAGSRVVETIRNKTIYRKAGGRFIS